MTRATLALIVLTVPALTFAQEPLLSVPFDGSDAAALDLNGPQEITGFATRNGPYAIGVNGQARELGGMNRLRFFLNDGFVPPEGTLSLWVRPVDWTPADARHFVFFARLDYTENEAGYVRMVLYKLWNTDEVALLVQNTPETDRAALVKVAAPDWEEGRWHHLAATWDADFMRLYVDGEQVGQTPPVALPAEGRWELSIGTPYDGWSYIGQEKNAIDDVRVYPEALSAEAIRAQYDATLAAASPEALEPPERVGPPPVEGNLALADDGAYVLASSFADYEEHYPDNLIDGREESVWAPLQPTLPQWFEVRWRLPRRVDAVVLRQAEAGHVSALTVEARLDGAWQEVATLADVPADASELAAGFAEVTTDRVRVTLTEGAAEGLELSTLAVTGPDQPILPPTPLPTKTPERVSVLSATVTPPEARPGDTVRVEATVASAGPLAEDYAFAFEVAETPQEPNWSDLFVAGCALAPDEPTTQWAAGQEHTLAGELRLPEWAPDGAIGVRLVGMTAGGLPVEVANAEGEAEAKVDELQIRRFDAPTDGGVAGARLDFSDGRARWLFGDEPVAPIGWAMTIPSWDRYGGYSSTGAHVYHAKSLPLNFDDAPGEFERVCSQLDERMRSALRVDPNALFIVNPDLRPEQSWLARNPDERLVTAHGNLGPICFSSVKYTEGVHDYLRRLVRYVGAQDYADHVVGWLPYVCGSPDSVMGGTEDNLFQEDRSRLTLGDYNPQAVANFQQWLRAKYAGSVEDLRAAWQDPALSFETARPVIEELTAEGVDGGVFRDPAGNQMTFDYTEWMSGVVGRFNSELMRIVKEEAGRDVLAGTYYGYNVAHMRSYNVPGSFLQNNNADFIERLQDPNWDFFAEPTPYSNRRPGTSYYTSHSAASLRLHGKLHMAEIDHRTFIAGAKTYGRMRSERETQAVMRRDMSALTIAGQGYWFSDWSRGSLREAVPWFDEPGILGAIEEARETHETALASDGQSVSQIAVITSERTMRYHDAYRASPIYHNLVPSTLWEAMGKIGAPYDLYAIDDLAEPQVRDGYKLYVFLNAFFLRPEDRARTEALKADGRTLLFLYAPGYATRERGLSVQAIGDLVGMNVVKRADREWMEYATTDAEHPVLQGLESSSVQIEAFDYELSRKLHPPELGPVFAIDDADATVLGAYPDGQAAFAARDLGAWKSAYCAVPRMPTDLLRGVARWAGVHLYCEQDVVMDADSRLLMLHSGWDGDRELTISLPRSATVTDAWTGETLCTNADRFTVTLPECSTRLLEVGTDN